MINTVYNNIYSLVIGKMFNAADVGYFNRGNQCAELPSQTITTIVTKVSYPVLVEFQDDNKKLTNAYEKLLRLPLYFLFPLLFGMCILARPLIAVVLGEKWLPAAPILQILCFGYCWVPLTHINLNLLYVKGRSDLVLKLELIKKSIAFVIVFIMLQFGLLWLCIGKALYSMIAFSLNCYYTHKILRYGLTAQLKNILPILLNSALMAFCVYLGISFFQSNILRLFTGVVIGIISYLLLGLVFKDQSLKDILNIVKDRRHGPAAIDMRQ